MSHEFRTPLNSMLALSRAPARRPRRARSPPEQRRQVGYIRQAADDLSELVNDLLDLATVEAGKTVVRPAEFDLRNLFAALRGMLRPLLVNESVALVFEEPEDVPLAAHGRGQGVADPAQLPLERAEVHRARRDPGDRAAGARRRDPWSAPSPTRGSASRPRTRSASSRSSPSSTIPCRGACAAPASGCPSCASSPPCWAATCRSRARSASARPSRPRFLSSTRERRRGRRRRRARSPPSTPLADTRRVTAGPGHRRRRDLPLSRADPARGGALHRAGGGGRGGGPPAGARAAPAGHRPGPRHARHERLRGARAAQGGSDDRGHSGRRADVEEPQQRRAAGCSPLTRPASSRRRRSPGRTARITCSRR